MPAALLGGRPGSAQDFGRNKVQYNDLDFCVLKTERLGICFYPQERAGVDGSARLAERWFPVGSLARIVGTAAAAVIAG